MRDEFLFEETSQFLLVGGTVGLACGSVFALKEYVHKEYL